MHIHPFSSFSLFLSLSMVKYDIEYSLCTATKEGKKYWWRKRDERKKTYQGLVYEGGLNQWYGGIVGVKVSLLKMFNGGFWIQSAGNPPKWNFECLFLIERSTWLTINVYIWSSYVWQIPFEIVHLEQPWQPLRCFIFNFTSDS